MDLFYGFFNTILGTLMVLKGFRIFKSTAKDESEIEREELWHSKWGTFFKIGGIILAFFGVLAIIKNL